MPTETSEEKERFWETLKSELPAFLWWLEHDFQIPEDLKSSRFGDSEFHHPELLAALDELSPSHALEGLIDHANIWGAVDNYWEGTALELRSLLLNNDRTRRDAERLLNWTNATGATPRRSREAVPAAIQIAKDQSANHLDNFFH